jgi:ABC-type glycerol-3-phosphate transport system substrate-binding protein
MKRKLLILAVVVGMVLLAPAAHAAPVKLTYWHALGTQVGAAHEELIAEFNAAHPDIQVEPLYSGSLWTFRDKLMTSIAGGQAPDIAYIDQFWSPQLARTGAIVKMQDFIEGPNGIDRDDIVPIAWETATVDGEIWTMPYAISNQVLYYNKDMFREVGLDPEKPPTNWDELIEYGKLLTRDVTGDGKVDEWGLTFPLKADEGGVYYYITHLWQAGGELYNEDFTAVAFNDEFGEKAAQFWWDLVHEHEITPLAPPAQGFQTGRIAMELGTSARLAAHLEQVTFELGIAHMPSDEVKVTGLGGGNLAIFQNSPEKLEAAWTFVKWMTSPEINLKWSKMTGYVPLRKSVLYSDDYQAFLKENPMIETFVSQLDYMRPRPNVLHYADMSRVLGLAVERIVFSRGDVNIQKILDDAAEEANDIVAKMQ